ncbi:hypothetical protein QWM81_28970, partial [Streptomyces ficellus]
PPSTTQADHHTPGSTAGSTRQTPHPRSSSRTHLTASVQKHLLSDADKQQRTMLALLNSVAALNGGASSAAQAHAN